MASRRGNGGNDGTETEREPQYKNEETDFDLRRIRRRDTEAAISDASARSSRRRTVERAQRRAYRSERGRREEEDITDASRRSKTGRDGSTRKHSYHMERVTESESDTGNGTEESDHSRWRMGTGKASKKKERSVGHRSKSLDGHYRKERGPNLKIACPIFKGKKHYDPDVHIQAFEQYVELKHILEEEE
ncbi:hypothetical protein L7F22_028375 [Adiantum nelumboides]|nr:hypothetical protein [Adiantum nelumboides]